MGVPGFYKWLTERYPLVVMDVIEEEEQVLKTDHDDEQMMSSIDTSKPNPNKIEFDNLYLDLNGIIGPSFAPNDRPPQKTRTELFKNMFDYIDRIFAIVRPRKLLYMVLDGVAPMAKTDQQRSRRFKSAKDVAEAEAEEERLQQEFEKEGRKLFPPKSHSKVTVVTVGSKFIAHMIAALQYYIHLRLNKDPGWRSIEVILSDAYVPGEAEHKIMAYIRLQRNLPGYDPNTRHCLYGLDADLIMLALTTHEVHFAVLREMDNCFQCGKTGHLGTSCKAKGKSNENCEGTAEAKQPYQFLNIWTLREYLDYEMRIPNPPFEIDFECILDDFIFMCFFLGNDFLPQMPTLVIREGAINLMINVYRKEFASMGGYLTDSGKPNLSRTEHFIQAVGAYEDEIFKKRTISYQRRVNQVRHEKAQPKKGDDAEPQFRPESVKEQKEVGKATDGMDFDIQSKQSETSNAKEIYMLAQKIAATSFGATVDADNDEAKISIIVKMIENEEELGMKLCDVLEAKGDPFNPVNLEANKVKLGESGWKERYYKEKFSAKCPDEIETIQKDVVLRYTEGLCWLMRYYYEGICSWQWFYPYHYAPFASDMKDLGQLKISFELGVPWKPLDQLMGVLPVASSHALPEHYRKLMTDPDSPIIDFYPTDFEVDMEGKWYSNQGVVKIPFIDEGRLLAETKKVEHTLTEDEVLRNRVTFDMLYVTLSHPLSPYIVSVHDHTQCLDNERSEVKKRLDPKASDGVNGYLAPFCGDPCPPIFKSPFDGLEDIMNNQVICAIYGLPDVHKHITRPPAGVIFPKKSITERDLKPPPFLRHEDTRKKPWESRKYFSNKSYQDKSRPHPSSFSKEKEMQSPPATNARRQLGEAARQLIVKSMQIEKEHIGMNPSHEPSNATGTSSSSLHSNVGHHSQEHLRPVPPRVGFQAHTNKPTHSTDKTFQNHSIYGYRDPYASSSSSSAQHSPRYERNDWTAATHRSDLPVVMGGHRPSLFHNAGSQFPPRNTENTPMGSRAYIPPRGGYNDNGRYDQAHRASDHHREESRWGENPKVLGRRPYQPPRGRGNDRY